MTTNPITSTLPRAQLCNKHWRRIIRLIVSCILAISCQVSLAIDPSNFGLGMQVGGADVNWDSLIGDKITADVMTSNPTQAGGTGLEYGAFVEWYLGQRFAFQSTFNNYPAKEVVFNSVGITPLHDNIARSLSIIHTWSLDEKYIVPVWSNAGHALSINAIAGLALMFRHDSWVNKTNVGGHFGCGTSYQFTPRYSTRINFDYYTGNGKATEHPIDSYFPFLYSINVGLGIRL